jgi:hypothetical protein
MEDKKFEFNTKDIVANLRIADSLLVKVADFLLSVPFLASPLLWKVLLVIFFLLVPLTAVISIISTLGGIIFVILGNFIGLIVAVLTLGYTVWLAKTTLFNKESDLKISDLRGWSKIWMLVALISLLTTAIQNIWISSIVGAIQALVTDFITITITMYLVPFACRYFYGVVMDGLRHHPDSKYALGGSREEVMNNPASVVQNDKLM